MQGGVEDGDDSGVVIADIQIAPGDRDGERPVDLRRRPRDRPQGCDVTGRLIRIDRDGAACIVGGVDVATGIQSYVVEVTEAGGASSDRPQRRDVARGTRTENADGGG